ncbi:hypothetical protein JCGZ_13172 [Jatropha curcas]|uniref:Uncharacterized protein n=1 Tax=Jatropha curcas TaxID=180498 RepID=A0A067K922_JATCU|nr:hypothetical protein JCGZ_13172 [Jatropha curcas]
MVKPPLMEAPSGCWAHSGQMEGQSRATNAKNGLLAEKRVKLCKEFSVSSKPGFPATVHVGRQPQSGDRLARLRRGSERQNSPLLTWIVDSSSDFQSVHSKTQFAIL